MEKKFLFITSTRFWALVILSVCVALNAYGVLPTETLTALITLLGGFITVRTLDRFSDPS